MSFIGAGTDTKQISFYNPEPANIDIRNWAEYPAITDIDLDGHDILNLGNISISNVVSLTVDTTLDVLGNANVVGTLSADRIVVGTSGDGEITAHSGHEVYFTSSLGGLNQVQFGKNSATAAITHNWNSVGEGGYSIYRGSAGSVGTSIAYNGITMRNGSITASKLTNDKKLIFYGSDVNTGIQLDTTTDLHLKITDQNFGLGTADDIAELTVGGIDLFQDTTLHKELYLNGGNLTIADDHKIIFENANANGEIGCAEFQIGASAYQQHFWTSSTKLGAGSITLPRASYGQPLTINTSGTFGFKTINQHQVFEFGTTGNTLTIELLNLKYSDGAMPITNKFLFKSAYGNTIVFKIVDRITGLQTTNPLYSSGNSGYTSQRTNPYTFTPSASQSYVQCEVYSVGDGSWAVRTI